jgi:hypothetical protein
MRNKAILLAGLVVGYVIGARAGRERYDQLVKLGRQAAGHPAVRSAAKTTATKAADLAKAAAAKAPELAKAAAPKIATVAKQARQAGQQAASRLPFTGKGDDPFDEATDGPDASVPYQAEGSPASYNGVRAE